MVSSQNESLNTMEDIKVTKLDNLITNSIINPILLTQPPMLKVFFFSFILELKDSSKNH